MQLVIGRLFHPVEFIVVHLGKVIPAFFDHHVAGRTRAASAAGMLQMEAEIHGDVEHRLRLPVALVRQLALLEFERLARWQECDSRHFADYSG